MTDATRQIDAALASWEAAHPASQVAAQEA
jgi:hypothetical protein